MKTMNLNRHTAERALKFNFDALLFIKLLIKSNYWHWHLKRIFNGLERIGGFELNFIFVILGMSLGSCQKLDEQFTVIEGKVVEHGTFEPIRTGGLRLALFETGSSGLFSTYQTKLTEVTTNENGEFVLEVRLAKNPESYFIQLLDRPNNYFLLDNLQYLKSRVINVVSFNLHREAWLKVTLNNEGGGVYDYFRFSINSSIYSHTGGGKHSVIQRIPSYDTCRIYLADFRYDPTKQSEHQLIALPNDTIQFEIDLRQQ